VIYWDLFFTGDKTMKRRWTRTQAAKRFGFEGFLGHVWMEVLVLVCSKLIPKLTFWSQTHVLVWC
jgi:hypothetical protein